MTQNCKHSFVKKGSCLMLPLLFLSVILVAQGPVVNEPDYSRPALFADLPDTVFVAVADVESLFAKKSGEQVQLKMTGSFFYSGYIKAITVMENPQRVSLVIRSTNKLGSAFYITKITEQSGQIHFRGRIISHLHIDAYDLAYSDGSGCYLKKSSYYKLVNE
jgi:hypothetical protein